MKRNTILYAIIAMVLILSFALGGCKVTKEQDDKLVVATVNGVALYKKQFKVELKNTLSQYYTANPSAGELTGDALESYKMQVLNGMIRSEMARQLADKAGYLKLTAAEKQKIDSDYETNLQNAIKTKVAAYRSTDKTSTDAQLTAKAEKAIFDDAGMTKQEILATLYLNQELTNYQKSFKTSATVTDKEINDFYMTYRAQQKNSFENDYTAYETALTNNTTLAYKMPGYRRIKVIAINIEAKKVNELNEIEHNAYNPVTWKIMDKNRYAEAEMKRNEYLKPIQTKADQIYALAEAQGADFDKLVQQYDEGKGWQSSEDVKQNGYLVSTLSQRYSSREFVLGALAIKKVGDVALVGTNYGYVIMKYVRDEVSGFVPLADIKAKMTELTKQYKKNNAFSDFLDQQLANAKVRKYTSRLNIIDFSTATPKATATTQVTATTSK